MAPEDLLDEVARALRHEVGPAVVEPYPKTQAFMAAVVLEKLAGQLRGAAERERADLADRAALLADLEADLGPSGPAALREALAAAHRDPGAGALGGVVAALYQVRGDLGEERFERLLGRARATLRARLDRQLAYAA
jgi:hypothetical protein